MRNPVEITLRGVPRSGALERYVAEEADKLDLDFGRILACNVVIEAVHRPKQQGAQFAVRVNITLPGTEVVVNREHGDDVYIALRDAFQAVRSQLRDHVRRIGKVARHSQSGKSKPER